MASGFFVIDHQGCCFSVQTKGKPKEPSLWFDFSEKNRIKFPKTILHGRDAILRIRVK